MSIKRSKQRSGASGRGSNDDKDPWAKPAEPEKTWTEQLDGKADDAFVPYAMSARYAKGALLTHPKFGKGVVTHVEGARIEVLFEEGAKKLGHGQ